MIWTEFTWLFCKRRKFEAQLRKDLETNLYSFPSYIFTYKDYVTIFRRSYWNVNYHEDPLYHSNWFTSLCPPHEHSPGSPWLKFMCMTVWVLAVSFTTVLSWPHRPMSFLSVSPQPRRHSTVKPVLAITSVSTHCKFCQPSKANLFSFLTLLILLFTLWVFKIQALLMNPSIQQTLFEHLTHGSTLPGPCNSAVNNR